MAVPTIDSADQSDGSRVASVENLASRRTTSFISAILAVGALFVLALWTGVFALIASENRTAMTHASNEASNLSAAFQGEAIQMLNSVAGAIELVAKRMRAEPGTFNIHDWSGEVPLLSRPATTVSIIGPDGRLLSTTVIADPTSIDLSDREHFRVHLDGKYKGLFVSKSVLERVSGEVAIQVSRRVDGTDGRFLGVVVFSIPASRLATLHKSIDVGKRGQITLFGTDNIVRARFGADNPDGVIGAGASLPLLPARMGLDETRDVTHIAESPIDHVIRLYSDRRLGGYPLFVGVGLDLDTILAPARVHARQIQMTAAIATLLLGGLLIMLTVEIKRRAGNEMHLAHERSRLAVDIVLRQRVETQLRESEQKFRDIAEVGADWIWQTDAAHRFTFMAGDARAVLEEQTGLSPLDTFGRTRWELAGVESEQDEKWRLHKAELDAHKLVRVFRYSMTVPAGGVRHFAISGKPILDSNGTFLGYRGTATDETRVIKALERAEQAESLLRDAVDSISEGFVIYDSDDRLLLCNDSYRNMYPESADHMVPGVTFAELLRHGLAGGQYPDAVGREEAWLAQRLEQHAAAKDSLEHPSGNGKWVLVTDRRMRNGGIAGLRINIAALKNTQVALRESEERLDRAQEIAGIGDWELDIAAGRYIWSKQMYRMRGYSPETFDPTRATVATAIHPDDLPMASAWIADLQVGRARGPIEVRIARPDGEVRLLGLEARPVVDSDGIVRRLAGTMQDITERRLIEHQLAHAQKMEAIGTLTGGMAHDFNNVLGVIIGNLDLLGRRVKADAIGSELCGEALDGATRCAALIQRLLAFARRQPLRPERTEVNALVSDIARLLGRTIGENIALRLDLDSTLWPVTVDPAQLEAALLNLAANARDAMPRGGTLDIITRNVHLDASYVALHPEVGPGDYSLIEISDTGTGIPPEIIGRIFEPFFSTKGPAKGTGLGLSMAYGFVKQSGGHLSVYSEPGQGTTFRLYLPRTDAGETASGRPAKVSAIVGGNETVLLVEDNAQLRRAAARQLTELGYQVREAEHADAALVVLTSGERIDLLFSDMVMPGTMDGLDLAYQAALLQQGLKILLTSGFPSLRGPDERIAGCPFRLLSKPYRSDELARVVRQVLDGDGNGPSAKADGFLRD